MAGSTQDQSASAPSGSDQRQQGSGSSESLGAAATGATEQIQEHVVNLTQQVRQQATDQLLSQKDRVVDALETVALLLHQAGEQAKQQDKAMLAGYVDRSAEQVTQWSDALREQDVTQLLEETRQLARRQPMLFVGGALAAGFLGARFLRSSAQQHTNTTSEVTAAPGGDVPPYDIDHPADGGLGTTLDTPLAAATSSLTAMTPEEGGFLEDYEGAVLEGDNPDAPSVTDAAASPERL